MGGECGIDEFQKWAGRHGNRIKACGIEDLTSSVRPIEVRVGKDILLESDDTGATNASAARDFGQHVPFTVCGW